MPAIRPVTVDPRKPLVALSFAGSLCLTGSAWADERPAAMPVAQPASPASVTAAGAAHELPILLQARRLQSRPDLDATAEGDVEFRRGTLRIQADQVVYDIPQDLARALKQKCGVGGSLKDGQIEIQGDQRPAIKTELEKRGFSVRIAGG